MTKLHREDHSLWSHVGARGFHPVIAAVLILALACKARQDFPEHRPYEPDPKTAAEVTDDDVAVFEAVIAAYAESGEVVGLGAAPVGAAPLSGADVARLSSERGLQMLAGTRRCGAVRLTGWWGFAGRAVERLALPQAAADEFDKRNTRRVALDRFHPKYLNVIRANELGHDTVSIQLPSDHKATLEVPGIRNSGCMVGFTLPGYSVNRDVAVVEIIVYAPSPYGSGSEFVLLRRTDAVWQALAKQTGCVT
jgi:hypothetical protein